jgi:hypothetical protein
MSDKPYEKECTFCNNKILMSKQSGQWKPYNLNNGPHECKKKNGNNNELSLEVVFKKLESIGVTIDLNKLRNAK